MKVLQKSFCVTGVRVVDRKPVEYVIQADSAGAAIADAEAFGIEVAIVTERVAQVATPPAQARVQQPVAGESRQVAQKQVQQHVASPSHGRIVSGTTIPGVRTLGIEATDASIENAPVSVTPNSQIKGAKASYELYSPSSVVLASFLGTPIAGGQLLAANFQRLGNPRSGRKVWALCTLAFLGLFGGWIVLEVLTPSAGDLSNTKALTVVQCCAMTVVANRLQGRTIKDHQTAGGKVASRWRAAGVGLLWLVVMVPIYFGVLLAIQNVAM